MPPFVLEIPQILGKVRLAKPSGSPFKAETSSLQTT